jgi:adenosylcobyric acid synthase
MNPILLKPNGDGRSQVVVRGGMWRTLSAREYYAQVDELRPIVLDAFAALERRFDVVVIEGAGSVTELNLRGHDLANLELVTRIRAPWILVADIERGGVFGSIVGTTHLLTAEERELFRGFAINRFRGDVSLFDEGVRILEGKTAARCVGVFPYLSDVHLDAEDSLALDTRPRAPVPAGARIAIVRLPHLSNATDFRLLDWADWLASPPPDRYDFIVLPGTKNTIDDLQWLRRVGLAEWIKTQHRAGARIVGICGGFQMLGRRISDPTGVESTTPLVEGLGLLAAETLLTREKRVRVVRATTAHGVSFAGYEIHLGTTSIAAGAAVAPFATLEDGLADGARGDGIVGTYLHGAFEHADVCAEVFGVMPAAGPEKAAHYARMADWFEEHGRHLDRLGFG